VEICRKAGVRLIEDDIYGDLVEDGPPRSMLAWDDGSTVSYVTSFSKSISPGLRAGFCVPGTLHEEFAARKCQQDLHSAVTTEATLREFIGAGELDPHLKGLHERNRRRRTLGLSAIRESFPAGTQVIPPRGGYMLWAELPEPVDLAEIRRLAREHRVVFAAGSVFFPMAQGKSYLRLNCAKASEEELQQGLRALGEVICSATAPASTR
jgi:DNA-binding transcriptional MocR family regulator